MAANAKGYRRPAPGLGSDTANPHFVGESHDSDKVLEYELMRVHT